MRTWRVWTTAWIVLVTLAQIAAFVLLWRFFVRTETGQRLDTIALSGASIGQARTEDLVDTVLDTMSALSVAAAMLFLGFIALARRRLLVAVMTAVLIAGANLTTQVLKIGLVRPDLDVDEARVLAGNSLPSGHTTVAMSVAVALVLALPTKVRAAGACLGTLGAAVVGVATMSAGWHRPSDAVAAMLVVGVWASTVSLVLLRRQRHTALRAEASAHRSATVLLTLAGLGLLAVAAVAVQLTDQVAATPPEALGRRRLVAAYAGSAAGITGVACLVMAAVLAVIHRVVPPSAVTARPAEPGSTASDSPRVPDDHALEMRRSPHGQEPPT